MLNETIKNELLGWKKWEIIWLVLTSILITGVSIYISDKPLGIITALFGILCVICTGKGKLSAYVFGLLHAITYSIIAFQSKYYGEVMLNLIYYLPMQLTARNLRFFRIFSHFYYFFTTFFQLIFL